MEKIINKLIVSPEMYNLLFGLEIIADRSCSDTKMYIIDKDHRVHVFDYLGKIARAEESPKDSP